METRGLISILFCCVQLDVFIVIYRILHSFFYAWLEVAVIVHTYSTTISCGPGDPFRARIFFLGRFHPRRLSIKLFRKIGAPVAISRRGCFLCAVAWAAFLSSRNHHPKRRAKRPLLGGAVATPGTTWGPVRTHATRILLVLFVWYVCVKRPVE